MDVFKDIVLILCVLGVFAFGYFLAARLEKYLYENKRSIENADHAEEPSRVILPGDTSDEDLLSEVHKFRDRHDGVSIVLTDKGANDRSADAEDRTEQKQ